VAGIDLEGVAEGDTLTVRDLGTNRLTADCKVHLEGNAMQIFLFGQVLTVARRTRLNGPMRVVPGVAIVGHQPQLFEGLW
jgi:hypothetical protein